MLRLYHFLLNRTYFSHDRMKKDFNFFFFSKSMLYSYDHMNNSNTVTMQLGLLIRSERKKRSLTQTQLGEISGTSINFISQIEAGKSSAQVGKIFQVLQVLGFELLCRRGKKGFVISDKI